VKEPFEPVELNGFLYFEKCGVLDHARPEEDFCQGGLVDSGFSARALGFLRRRSKSRSCSWRAMDSGMDLRPSLFIPPAMIAKKS